MKFTTIAVLAFSFIAFEASPSAAQVRAVLDLTPPLPASPGDDSREMSAVVDLSGPGSHATEPPPVLRLSIEWLDGTSYFFAAPFVTRLVVTNVSSEPVRIPWSRDDGRVFDPHSDREWAMAASITLSADMPDGHRMYRPLGVVYGSVSEPSSIHTLRPGESAEIIASGRFTTFREEEEAQFAGGRMLAVHAEFRWLRSEEGTHYGHVRSAPMMIELLARGGLRE